MSWVKPVIADEPQKVEFLQEWMGNPSGSKKVMWKCHAEHLKKRGVVQFVDSDEGSFTRQRSLGRPPKDKMIHSPKVMK